MSWSAIPYLKSEVLTAAQQELDSRDTDLPLFQFFPREQYDGEELELRVKVVRARRGHFVGPDQQSVLVKPGELDAIKARPLHTRHKHRWNASEIALFRSWDEIVQTRGAPTESIDAKVQRKIAEVQLETSSYSREALHSMLVGALQGSWVYNIGGVNRTVSHGLTPLTAPGTAWDNVAAKIITDIHGARKEFRSNSRGKDPDTVFYNPDIWADYLAPNTEFQTYIKEVPGLAQFFAGIRQGLDIVNDAQEFIDPFFGMMWVPISGAYVDTDGSTVNRWDQKKLVLAALRGPDRVLEHSMTTTEHNPSPMPMWRMFSKDDPITHYAEHSDNGAAVISLNRRVQTWQIVP